MITIMGTVFALFILWLLIYNIFRAEGAEREVEYLRKELDKRYQLKVFVFAGNFIQYLNWLKEQELTPQGFVYLTKTNWLGCHEIPLVKVGTWYERKDINIREVEFYLSH